MKVIKLLITTLLIALGINVSSVSANDVSMSSSVSSEQISSQSSSMELDHGLKKIDLNKGDKNERAAKTVAVGGIIIGAICAFRKI